MTTPKEAPPVLDPLDLESIEAHWAIRRRLDGAGEDFLWESIPAMIKEIYRLRAQVSSLRLAESPKIDSNKEVTDEN